MPELPPRYTRALGRAVDLARHRHHRVADSRHLLRVLLADLSEGRSSSAWLLHDAGADPIAVQDALEGSLASAEKCAPAADTPPRATRMLTRVVADAAALAEQRGLSVQGIEVLLVVCLADPALALALGDLPEVGTRLWDRVVGPVPAARVSHPHAS